MHQADLTAIKSCASLTLKTTCMCIISECCATETRLWPSDIKEASSRVYWDGGPAKIKEYLDHHARMCTKNRFCVSLGLSANPDLVSSASPPKSRKGKGKGKELFA